MNRPIRIGLIAEGETELGASIPKKCCVIGYATFVQNLTTAAKVLTDRFTDL